MLWNWQRRKWPHFEFNKERFAEYDHQFFEKAGQASGTIHFLAEAEQKQLRVDLMSAEALKTSEIEGEFLSRDSLQSSIRRQFGIQSDFRKVAPAEQGIAEVMVHLYQNYALPLDDKTLFLWHKMITYGRHDLKDIGRYRTHEDPMQVVSGPIARPVVHFEAPPSLKVPAEMSRFLAWLDEAGRQGDQRLPVVVRAAVAHLYFECIHPFEDGNGRIGRAISIKSLSQSLGRPLLLMLSQAIQEDKKRYYKALESNNKDLDVSEWVTYFCEIVLKAQDYAQLTINFIIEKGKFYQRFERQLNNRQKKVVDRMFIEGVSGFKGGLSAKNYATITGAPSATTTRDLTRLVEIDAFRKTGELKSTRYHLNIAY